MTIPWYSTFLVVAAALAVVAPGSSALAQGVPETDIKANIKATPSKAGTKGDPRGHALHGTVKLTTEPGFDPPIVTGAEILIGRGFVWNGHRYPKCSKRTLDRRGPKGCPRESIMGTAKGTARADTVITHPDVVFVNGGSKRSYAYTTLYHPALVQEPIVVRSKKMRGRWSYRESFRVPKTLQVVAGVPIQMTGLRFRMGGKRYAPEWITSTSCPRGGWRYRAKVRYLYDLTGRRDVDMVKGRIPCRR